jgi:hypothetical protein
MDKDLSGVDLIDGAHNMDVSLIQAVPNRRMRSDILDLDQNILRPGSMRESEHVMIKACGFCPVASSSKSSRYSGKTSRRNSFMPSRISRMSCS